MTVNRVRCSGPITNADFLCHAVRSARRDHTLHPEYSLRTCSCFPTSGHLHSFLLHDAYALTELLIFHSIFLSYTFNTRMLSIVLNVLFQIIPDNATSKYKLILLYITVNADEIYIFVFGRTDSHLLDTRFTPSTTTTVLAVTLDQRGFDAQRRVPRLRAKNVTKLSPTELHLVALISTDRVTNTCWVVDRQYWSKVSPQMVSLP